MIALFSGYQSGLENCKSIEKSFRDHETKLEMQKLRANMINWLDR